jgi:membrane protein implicated in regulation of membrane protease activity
MGAAAVAFLGGGLALQILVFLTISIALTIASRTIFENVLFRSKGADVKMGVASLPGQIGTVVESSRGALAEGAVKVFGSTWTAFPVEGEPPLEEGERVAVERVDGAVIYVRRMGPRELESWRS